jgi:hypothetical protein
MNAFTRWGDASVDPFLNPLDAILAEIAINLQLPPGLHAKAVKRYEAVRTYIERDGSPLHDKVAAFYPQGSMAIDATISTRGTDDEYDLDFVAELLLAGYSPSQVLDLLEAALAGYPAKVIRQTRCITVQYTDGMHIDVTPSIRLPNPPERESVICHAKPGEPTQHGFVDMNAFGFGQWYCSRTPTEERFAKAFNRRLYEAAGLTFAADADVHDVPEQTPLLVKSTTTVAHQLLKRFRNILYAQAPGRIPPSVVLACHAGEAAAPGMPLTEMVIRQARWTAKAIDEAARAGRLLDVRNPVWARDVFTDRWPVSDPQQTFFARRLHALADGLETAKRQGAQLEDLQAWLREDFGDRVVTKSIEGFSDRLGGALKSTSQVYTRKGGVFVPSAPTIRTGAAASVLAAPAARAHTNMGERR